MTGSERARQRRADQRLALEIYRFAMDSVYLPSRDDIVRRFGCSVFAAERAIRLIYKGESLD